MSELDRLLEANAAHAEEFVPFDGNRPTRRVAVLTCMDCRIEISEALGLEFGSVHVLRNAGARVTDDVLRSLALSVHVLGVRYVVVMHHTGCGLEATTDDELRAATGANLDFLPIDDQPGSIRDDVDAIAGAPFLGPIEEVSGLLYDLQSGRAEELVRWSRR